MARKLKGPDESNGGPADPESDRSSEVDAIPMPTASGDPDPSAAPEDRDLGFFDWAGHDVPFFAWAGSKPSIAGELEQDAESVRRALQTIGLIDAMESFYGTDLFWAELFGVEIPAAAAARVNAAEAYAKMPKGTIVASKN